MNKFYLIFLFLAGAIFFTVSCKKDGDTPLNTLPLCVIAQPNAGEVFAQGNTINILVEASDSEGLIEKIVFLVNDVEIGTDFSLPYEFAWNTSDLAPGTHKIATQCFDNSGESSRNEIDITLIEVELFIDPRDGQEYETVVIGNQIWFAENLAYESPNSSFYSNSPLIGAEYGRLYDWEEANTVCPNGWHLPSDAEWKELEAYLGMANNELDSLFWRGTNEGSKLKCGYGWSSADTSSNSSYFSGLPGGYYNPLSSIFIGGGDEGLWWTGTESNTENAFYRRLIANYYQVYRNEIPKDHKLSVRCVKDL